MTFFVGLCSIFFVNKLAEPNFISENALTAELITSSHDNLVKREMNFIQNKLKNGSFVAFLQEYFENFQMSLQKQAYSFEEKGKKYEGIFKKFLILREYIKIRP